ncbi:hypothetical protein [Blastopirellula marina]|uniref:Secretin/TonB short N-terminal domain-containing protein n=1 Tax=Blastopirellula marina TaxID=124 RepID=A0A2S8FCV1_9BACT|nr:hypothetical protein [Blastopirellula marina]PQO29969.1 hypothetical protein C5Y98_22165 [Blastopirellula marina]PTL42437.1 hypothetical protein C5Y97_22175 [Blastopirellula marina]
MRALASLAVCLLLFCSPAWAQFGGNPEQQDHSQLPHEVLLSATVEVSQVIPQKSPDVTKVPQQERELFARLLTHKTSVAFNDLPLHNALKQLSEQAGIAIRIDEIALAESALSSSEKISLELENVSLYSVLKWLLRESELTFFIDVESIVVTTPAEAEIHLKTYFYAIPELIGNPAYYDEVIEAITSVIEPDSWEELGGPGSIAPFRNGLMISSSHEIHALVDQLFAGFCHFQTLPGTPYPTASYSVSLFPQRQREILRQLRTTEAKLAPTPHTWQAVLQQLRQQVAGPILVDEFALEVNNVRLPESVSPFPPEPSSLARTLDIITTDNDLAWFVAGDLIVITCEEEWRFRQTIELYPVRDLAWKGIAITNPQFQARLNPATKYPFPTAASSSPQDATFEFPDFDSVVELLTTTVDPESWEELGGPGSIYAFTSQADCLVISQHRFIHEQIQSALEQVRERQQPVDIDNLLAEVRKHEAEVITRTHNVQRYSEEKPLFSREDLQLIAEQLKKQIEPESWDGKQTYILPLNDAIVIRNRRDVQRVVSDNLVKLGVIRSQNYGVGFGCGAGPRNNQLIPQINDSSAQPTPASPQVKTLGGGGVF